MAETPLSVSTLSNGQQVQTFQQWNPAVWRDVDRWSMTPSVPFDDKVSAAGGDWNVVTEDFAPQAAAFRQTAQDWRDGIAQLTAIRQKIAEIQAGLNGQANV
jgi:hypothetical protein